MPRRRVPKPVKKASTGTNRKSKPLRPTRGRTMKKYK